MTSWKFREGKIFPPREEKKRSPAQVLAGNLLVPQERTGREGWKLKMENLNSFFVNLKKAWHQILTGFSKAESVRVRGQSGSIHGDEEVCLSLYRSFHHMGKCETEYTIPNSLKYLVREFERKGKKNLPDSARQGILPNHQDQESWQMHWTPSLPWKLWSLGPSLMVLNLLSSIPVLCNQDCHCGSLEDHCQKVVTENRIVKCKWKIWEHRKAWCFICFSTLNLETVEERKEEISHWTSLRSMLPLCLNIHLGSHQAAGLWSRKRFSRSNNNSSKIKERWLNPMPNLIRSIPGHIIPRSLNLRENWRKWLLKFHWYHWKQLHLKRCLKVPRKERMLLLVWLFLATRILEPTQLWCSRLREPLKVSYWKGKYESIVEKASLTLFPWLPPIPAWSLSRTRLSLEKWTKSQLLVLGFFPMLQTPSQTPTEELKVSLLSSLKPNIQRNRVIRAAYASGLTELVHKACVNPESMKNEFPFKESMDSSAMKNMSVIKDSTWPLLDQEAARIWHGIC